MSTGNAERVASDSMDGRAGVSYSSKWRKAVTARKVTVVVCGGESCQSINGSPGVAEAGKGREGQGRDLFRPGRSVLHSLTNQCECDVRTIQIQDGNLLSVSYGTVTAMLIGVLIDYNTVAQGKKGEAVQPLQSLAWFTLLGGRTSGGHQQ